jgi:hypothetical protein
MAIGNFLFFYRKKRREKRRNKISLFFTELMILFTNIIMLIESLLLIVLPVLLLKRYLAIRRVDILFLCFQVLLSLLQTITAMVATNYSIGNLSTTIYLLFEYLILGLVLEKNLKNTLSKKILALIRVIYCIAIPLYLILSRKVLNDNTWIIYFPTIILSTTSILLIRELLANPETNLLRTFEFWIAFGVLFLEIGSLPMDIISYSFITTKNELVCLSESLIHSFAYGCYFIILIYALKWTVKN